MDSHGLWLPAQLERLRIETGSDFAAFAAPLASEVSWRWIHASGYTNNRFLKLALLPGRGIAGAAFRTGRTIVLDRHLHANDLRKEDAHLLLAERLSSVAATPVFLNGSAIGLLLLGSRREREYGSDVVGLLSDAAARISEAGVIK